MQTQNTKTSNEDIAYFHLAFFASFDDLFHLFVYHFNILLRFTSPFQFDLVTYVRRFQWVIKKAKEMPQWARVTFFCAFIWATNVVRKKRNESKSDSKKR